VSFGRGVAPGFGRIVVGEGSEVGASIVGPVAPEVVAGVLLRYLRRGREAAVRALVASSWLEDEAFVAACITRVRTPRITVIEWLKVAWFIEAAEKDLSVGRRELAELRRISEMARIRVRWGGVGHVPGDRR
jgi:hypothetical protein